MGLDIHTFTNIRRIAPEEERAILADEYPNDEAYTKGYRVPWFNPAFPGREEGLEAVPYAFDEDIHFRAGSYSGHSQFREHLCTLLGLGPFVSWINNNKQGPDTHGPFEELINFSDCEGVIGPVVAKKLAKDFIDWEERAKEYALELNVKGLISQGWSLEKAQERAKGEGLDDGGYSASSHFWETYQNWKKAFAEAGAGGFVAFH